MRGRSSTNSSSISSPLRSLSNTGSPRTTANAPTPVSPGTAGFSTITIDRNRHNGILSGGGDSNGDSSSQQTNNGSTDLNQEVAALSNKLIRAINHQTLLDDSLTSTKHELELSKARIKQLEAVARDHEQMMAKGLLVDRKDMETEAEQFMRRIKAERDQRSKAERDKQTIEKELEHLTTALFEEANKMVAAARRERDMMDRKNEQLKTQLSDTEVLLQSLQDQLSELKQVMQQMTVEREEQPEISFSMPPSPALANRPSKESLARGYDTVSVSPSYSNHPDETLAPAHPTSFSQLITPVLRHDTASYHDFITLLRSPKRQSLPLPHIQQPPPAQNGGGSMYRLSAGSMASFQLMSMGMGIGGMTYTPSHSPTTSVSNAPSSPPTPNGTPIVALKETRFFKRALLDDIEPTLRLDIAPGLSWLAKRNTMSALSDGTLIIDPIPSSSRINLTVCTLCGESRNEDPLHVRAHRMRTSDTDNAQKYPLCGYCVNRVRVTCDFIGFLKLCKDGLWKCDGEADEKHAWEVCTIHREKMFWSRIGGGVVPTLHAHHYNGYYQGSVFGGRNSSEYGLGSGTMSPRKVSGMSTSTRGYSIDKRRSSMESQQEEAAAASLSKTREPSAPVVVRAITPPPVLPQEADATLTAAAPVKKEPPVSPLRRLWSMGRNGVLGDRNNNANRTLPLLTTPPSKDTPLKIVSEEKPSATENVVPPPDTPADKDTPVETPLTPEPQTPAFEREIASVAARRLGNNGGVDSPSSTRAMFGRDRGNSVVSVAETVIVRRDVMERRIEEQVVVEEDEEEDEEKKRMIKEAENVRRELEAEVEAERRKEEKQRVEAEEAEKKVKGEEEKRNQAKLLEEQLEKERHRAESPTIPGGWD
ncbi:hypothetical protein EV426DRAFT_449460 [Tirmania nivea]|nr:hypothetical protein EV426DRAFT_449460 [Tirmania nivea]